MPLDFGMLSVQRAIVHEVPIRRPERNAEPCLSEIDSPLTPDLQLYIKEKITSSAGSSYAFDVLLDLSCSSPIPRYVVDYLTGDRASFVELSQQIARHLYQIQTGVNSEGLAMVVDCSLGGQPCLAILKLERESGVRIEQGRIDGRRTLRIEHIRQLMLTQGNRVFKAGVFAYRGPSQGDIDAVVSDHQRGRTPREVADFFLSKFLGCRLAEAPAVTTKRFFEATQDFINEVVEDPERKARYQIALLAEMNNQQPSFSPRGFATAHLEVSDRQRYSDFVGERQIPDHMIGKDVELIESQLRRIQFDFESRISLIVPSEAISSDKVRITRQDNDLTKVEFEDRMTSTRGRR